MVIELAVIFICFIFFLFTLFTLSREDFVFMRKSIGIDDIFNIAFLTAGVTLFFSRLLYVMLHFDMSYLNPLVFFLVPYFPGLSLLGGVLGGALTTLLVTKRYKFPRGRFIDFFAYSFLSVLPIGYAGFSLIQTGAPIYYKIVPIVYFTVLFIFFMKMLLPRFQQGQMRDGMLGLLIFMNYALFTAIVTTIQAYTEKSALLTPQVILLLVFFVICLIFYIRQGAQLTFRRK